MRKAFNDKAWQRVIDLEKVADADNADVSYMVAEALSESGRDGQAAIRLKKLTTTKTTYTGPAHVRLAALDESNGKIDEALLHYEAATTHMLSKNLRAFVEERVDALKGATAPVAQDENNKNEEKQGE
jgi:hypothetical protein